MCAEWLDCAESYSVRALSSRQRALAMSWSKAYVARYGGERDDDADEDEGKDERKNLQDCVYTCVTCAMQLLCEKENDPEHLFRNPTKSLAVLSDEKRCLRVARDKLKGISELTPAYDCLSVAAMMRHMLSSPLSGSTEDWTGIGCQRVDAFEDMANVFLVPSQPRHVADGFTKQISDLFRDDVFDARSPVSSRDGSRSMAKPPLLHIAQSDPARLHTELASYRSTLRTKAKQLRDAEEALARANEKIRALSRDDGPV